MGTIKQRFRVIIKDFKIDIKKKNKKLLLAAVILFSASWSLVMPTKGVEQFLVPYLDKNKSVIIEQIQSEPNFFQESYSASQVHSAVSSLASLTNQLDSSETSDQNLSFEKDALAILQENALISQTSPITFISQEPRAEIINYLVQEGDTVSAIAASFGITTNSLLWANKLTASSIIRPGDELIILPASGILHRVKSGQTIDWIAQYYKAKSEDIIVFNDLPADGSIQIGQNLIVPDGQMPAPAPAKPTRVASQSYSGPGTGQSRSFPYGQCTWYLAQKRYVPWSGNANSWLVNARAYGFKTGSVPQTGAIMVLTEGGWLGRRYGHVAYVEAVTGSWVTISEMNYICRACKSVRTLKTNDRRIRGYIY